MNKLTLVKTTTIALTAALGLITLSGCQQEVEKPLTADEKIVAPNDHVRDMLKKGSNANQPVFKNTEAKPITENEEIGANMNTIIFDGSSEEAFRDGLDEFHSIANASEISALDGAIRFLKVYDLSARGNAEKLYQVLDGMTPEQIVERAAKIRRR